MALQSVPISRIGCLFPSACSYDMIWAFLPFRSMPVSTCAVGMKHCIPGEAQRPSQLGTGSKTPQISSNGLHLRHSVSTNSAKEGVWFLLQPQQPQSIAISFLTTAQAPPVLEQLILRSSCTTSPTFPLNSLFYSIIFIGLRGKRKGLGSEP